MGFFVCLFFVWFDLFYFSLVCFFEFFCWGEGYGALFVCFFLFLCVIFCCLLLSVSNITTMLMGEMDVEVSYAVDDFKQRSAIFGCITYGVAAVLQASLCPDWDEILKCCLPFWTQASPLSCSHYVGEVFRVCDCFLIHPRGSYILSSAVSSLFWPVSKQAGFLHHVSPLACSSYCSLDNQTSEIKKKSPKITVLINPRISFTHPGLFRADCSIRINIKLNVLLYLQIVYPGEYKWPQCF